MADDKGYEKSACFYDLFDKKENLDFFLKYGQETGGILDIGAGTGRIALYLAEKGIKVACVEPSPAMQREFLRKIQMNPELGKNITLITGDAQTFKVNEMFEAAFLSGSFDHIPNKKRVPAFQNINRHLQLKGKLIFDVYIEGMRDSPLSLVDTVKEGNHEYKRFIGTKVLPDKTIDVLLIYETYKQGKLVEKIEQQSTAYITTRTEIHVLLDETGFSIENEFSDYSFSPFKEGDSLLVTEASKIK
ncbi:MAG: class I SAM-dependent methyltransferase [Promethearchaeota archaeon]